METDERKKKNTADVVEMIAIFALSVFMILAFMYIGTLYE